MDEFLPDDVPVESGDLITLAREHGFHLTGRMLETFRDQGLMPRTRRVGYDGRRPIWAYPEGSGEQLLTLLRWREYTTDRNVLMALLWLAGHHIAVESVRQALLQELDRAETLILSEMTIAAAGAGIDMTTDDGEQAALRALAESMARKKEINTVLPRSTGGSLDERADTIATLSGMFLHGNAPDLSEAHAHQLETDLQLDRGRQATGAIPAWLTGPATDLFDALSDMNLTRMRSTLREASPEHWDQARPIADSFLRLFPVALAMMKALLGEDNPAGWGLLGGIGDDPQIVVVLIPLVLISLERGYEVEQIQDGLAGLAEHVAAAEPVLDMLQDDVERNLQDLPPEQQVAALRVVEGLGTGDFTPAPDRPSKRKPGRRRA